MAYQSTVLNELCLLYQKLEERVENLEKENLELREMFKYAPPHGGAGYLDAKKEFEKLQAVRENEDKLFH